VHPTSGILRVFRQFAWLGVDSAKMALCCPAHQRVMHTVGHLPLQSFWTNEAIFQLMMLAYNLFLLFKMDFAVETEYRQQIKTFRLKYIFLAGKIIRTARSVVVKLSEKYPYRERYEKCLC
jgi:hypothetical protein